MSFNLPKLVKRLGVFLLLLGFGLALAGVALPTPDAEVSYVQEFNENYAEENTDEFFDIPFIGDENNITASEVHTVYDSSDYSNSTHSEFKNNINSNETFKVSEDDAEKFIGNFIIEFENGSKHVYKGDPNGIYPPTLLLGGIIAITMGIFTMISIRGIDSRFPEDIEEVDDGEWEYRIRD
jgi:hypothetical protein